MPAHDSPAQREVGIEVFAVRRTRAGRQALLNFQVCLIADKCLMVAFAQRHIPVRSRHIPGIDGAGQDVVDLCGTYPAFAIMRELGVRFQKAHDFCLNLEAPRSIAFQRFLHDRSHWLVAHQHVAMSRYTLIAIAHRARERPIAVEHTRPHAVLGLFGVLAALVLGHGGKNVFLQLTVRIVAKLHAG
nr:hypothetical protein [Achromobacter insuavis]